MKITIGLWFCGLAISLSAQTQKTFTSPDGLFRFKYSEELVDCLPVLTRDRATTTAINTCVSQGQVCAVEWDESKTIACFAYPREGLKDTPELAAAMFFVGEIPVAENEDDCVKGSTNWLITKTATTTIHGVRFKLFETQDNWMSGGESFEIYRTFHAGKCFELGLQTVVTRGASDSEVNQKFSKRSERKIEEVIKQPLQSFLFVK